MDKVRILFLPLVDENSVNAQSLNVREIALRLDPERFQITLLYEREADSRLKNRAAIRLKQLPKARKTLQILSEMMSGYDIIGYMDYSPASYAFLHLPRFLRRGAKSIFHAEAPAAQMVNPSRTLRILYKGVSSRCDFHTGITEFVAQDVYKSLRKEVSHVLPVGVDTNLFTAPLGRSNTDPVILFAGTLIHRKGVNIVLDAAAQFPDAIFRIVGSAREGFEKVLEQRIAQSNLRNVRWEGAKTNTN